MDTLVAGHRKQSDGPVSEAVIAVEDETTGLVEIELTTFDENNKGGAMQYSDALIARSFITLPAGVMDAIVRSWSERHPEGVNEPAYAGALSTEPTSDTPAGTFLKERLSGR